MPSKKSKTAKKQAAAAAAVAATASGSSSDLQKDSVMDGVGIEKGSNSTSGESKSPPPSPPRPSPAQLPPSAPSGSFSPQNQAPPQEDVAAKAERVKEEGNKAFKAKKFAEAVDLYTKAIDLNPSEPAFYTNRAASYMALKRFRPALEDCQQAASLQSSSPSSKTLLRLGRCQLALGLTTPAQSTVNVVLAMEPNNTAAVQLLDKAQVLKSHLDNFGMAKKRKEWGMARLALDKCLQAIEGESGEIPTDWRIWRVELELCRKNWDGANMAANDLFRLNSNSPDVLTLRGVILFIGGKLPQAIQHAQSALRLDPGHGPAQKLRKRVKDIERLKEEGNVAFKSGRLQEAVDKYTEALARVGDAVEEGGGGQIRATLLSNRATTLLKLNKHQDALADTEASLNLVPTSFKAIRTRARINLHIEKFDVAVADFKSAIEQAQTEGFSTDNDVRALRTELKKAEAALKRSKTKDYYKILGLARDCNEADIKKAYKRESLKHHPDKGGDEEKFKLVAEANAVLSDPQRRARYDMGEDEDGMNGGFSGMGGGMNGTHVDMAELFAQFQGAGAFGAGPGMGGRGPRGFSHGFSF